MTPRAWLHDAYPKQSTRGRWLVLCDTCDAESADPFASRADATLAAASHIRATRPASASPPIGETLRHAEAMG